MTDDLVQLVALMGRKRLSAKRWDVLWRCIRRALPKDTGANEVEAANFVRREDWAVLACRVLDGLEDWTEAEADGPQWVREELREQEELELGEES